MQILLLVVTILTLAAAVEAHRRLPRHTGSSRQLRNARIVLIATGVAFGWVMARIYGAVTELNVVLIFLSGFGLIHVPAAAILFLKGQTDNE